MPRQRRQTGTPAPLTAERKQKLMYLLAQGYTPAEAAAGALTEGFGKEAANEVLAGILKDKNDLAYLQDAALKRLQATVPQAVSVLQGQLQSDSPWIQQGAARMIIDYASKAVTSDQQTTVLFGDMPKPGLPSGDVDE